MVSNKIDEETGVSQCFKTVTASMYVNLAPKYLNEPISGIETQHLNPLIMTYYAPVDGVILAYTNLQHEEAAKIMYDSPFAFLWITVEFLVWRPHEGDVLEGRINFQSPSHLGLLVHDTINATIKVDAIPEDWKFIAGEMDEKKLGTWTNGEGQTVEGMIKFTVKSFNVGKIVTIQGQLV